MEASFRMSKDKIGVVLLTISLLFVAEGCKKKGPAPPPPPAPKQQPAPPPPAPARPVISSFTVDPSTIDRGQSATLRWSSQNATSATIDNGIGNVPASGNAQVSPSATTTYRLTVSGAGGESSQTVTLRVSDPPPPPPPPATARRVSISEAVERQVGDAFYDYDKSEVREDARNVLQRNAEALKTIFREYTAGSVTIEGHCDERGSAEYNLGLGDRRATTARDFLVQLGVPADRLKVVSYGKERPQCTDSNETCWQKNRRAHFVGVE
jgi:peptidoglycan-associated lipoprotein